MAHKMGDRIEGFAVIIQKNAGINAGMYNQECDQEYTGKSHDELFSDRRSKKMLPGHKGILRDRKW
jgi:hypothetical protein